MLQIYGCMSSILHGLYTFPLFGNEVKRSHVKYDPIYTPAFMKYSESKTSVVENISLLLPQKFAIVFDGFTCADTHYLDVITMYTCGTSVGYQKDLLSLQSFEEEEELGSNENFEFVFFVMGFIGK